MKDDLFLIGALAERPAMVIVKLNGLGKVDFQLESAWVRDPEFKIMAPYPSTPEAVMDYAAKFVEDIGVVPFDNVAENEDAVSGAEENIRTFVKRMRSAESSNIRFNGSHINISMDLVITP